MTIKICVPKDEDIRIWHLHGPAARLGPDIWANTYGRCYDKPYIHDDWTTINSGIPYTFDVSSNTANAKKITLQTNEYFSKISSDHIIGFVNETATLSAYPDQYHTFNGYSITGGTLTGNQFKITQDTTAKANFSLKNGVNTFSASGDFGNGILSGKNKEIDASGWLWLSYSANVPTSWSSYMWDPILTFPQNAAKNLMLKVSYDFSAVKLNNAIYKNPYNFVYLTNLYRSGAYYSGFNFINENFNYIPAKNLDVMEPYTSHCDFIFYDENPMSAYRLVNRLMKFESGNNVACKIYNTTWTATGIRL